jgi:hypothetical protein
MKEKIKAFTMLVITLLIAGSFFNVATDIVAMAIKVVIVLAFIWLTYEAFRNIFN